ncbi:hypothetical protein DVA69_19355, partial [Acinetobacter baumannii]
PDYFVRTLITIIHAILPPKPKPKKDASKEDGTSEGKKTKFKALAIADNRDRVKEIDKEIELETREKHTGLEEWDGEREDNRQRG